MRGSSDLTLVAHPLRGSAMEPSFEWPRKMEANPAAFQSNGNRNQQNTQRAVINSNLGGGTIHAMYANVTNYHCNPPAPSELQNRNLAQLGPPSSGRISPAHGADFHHRSSAYAGRDPKPIHQPCADWQCEPPPQPACIQFQHQTNPDAQPEHPFHQHAYQAQSYQPYQAQAAFSDTIGYFQGQQDCTNQHQFFHNPPLRYLQQGEYYQQQPPPPPPPPPPVNSSQVNGQAQEQGFQQDFAMAFGAPGCVASQEAAPPVQAPAERHRAPVLFASINEFELHRNHFDRPLACRYGEPVGPLPAHAHFEQVGEGARSCASSFATLVGRPAPVSNQWAASGEGDGKPAPVATLGLVVDCLGARACGERERARAAPAANSDACTTSARPPSRTAGRNERQPLFAPASSTASTASATKPSSSTKRVRKPKSRARAGPKGRLVTGPNGIISRRKNATRETTAMLKDWLDEHGANPYPTKGEKIMLSIITKMNLTQVSTWFANARRRLKKENKAQPWNTFSTCHSGPEAASGLANGAHKTSSLASSNAFRFLMKGGESLALPATRQISPRTSNNVDGQPSSSTSASERNDESNK